MGLDTSHDCWHGAYSSFSAFRETLARAAGYAVWIVAEDDRPHAYKRPVVMLDWGHLGRPEHLRGEWDETPVDPLLVLIVHSDCDGEIRPAQQLALAARLEELAPLVADEDCRLGWTANDVRVRAERFAAGLRRAHALGEAVDFH